MTPAALSALIKGEHGNFMAASLPGGIEQQEKDGQTSFVAADKLPLQIDANERAVLESWGVKFGNQIDNLFQQAKLPEGWKKQATDHSMWSNLVDDKGRNRASIFFKAAFYDMDAFLRLNRAIGFDGDYGNTRTVFITKFGQKIHDVGSCEKGDYTKIRELEIAAKAWLAEHYPQWEDVSAYWA